MPKDLVAICYQKSIKLLLKNSSVFGFLASAPSARATERNYLNIFGRDASICAIGASTSGNQKLFNTAKNSLLTLAKYQAPNGQIPNYVKPELKQSDFWYLGCIDATLWWLIAIKIVNANSSGKINLERKLAKNIRQALVWLSCQEHQKTFLLQQNEASDWADIMPRSGFVLYTNALWYWVKKLYKIKTAELTKTNFNYIFYPWQKIPQIYFKDNHRAQRLINFGKEQTKSAYYLSYVNYSAAGTEKDVFGNILAIISGALDSKSAKRIISSFMEDEAASPFPIKTVLEPIKENSKSWREYMKAHNQNYPDQYHNGGIWPFVGGFWIAALTLLEKDREALNGLHELAKANSLNDWQFNEWLHGQTGEPMGMPEQSWNAATFILAYNLLKTK